MSQPHANNHCKVCTDLLNKMKSYNLEKNTLPSENTVIDHLVRREIELDEAYKEIYEKLHEHSPSLEIFLSLLITTAAFWNPERIKKVRDEREMLSDINQKIAKKSADLADLLDKRTALEASSGFDTGTYYHPADLIIGASQDNYLFQNYLKPKFDALSGQFDLKYWPKLSLIFRELSSDAANSIIEASYSSIAAATSSTRASLSDFFRVLLDNIETSHHQLPKGFRLTDRTLASLANCSLNLEPSDLIDDAYVKRFRQRERKNNNPT